MKKKSYFWTIPAAAVLTASLILVFTGLKAGKILKGNSTGTASSDKHIVSIDGVELEQGDYLEETTYDGSQPVDPVLFTVPFKKSDMYVSNRKLLPVIGNDTVKAAEDAAEGFVSIYLGTGYHKLSENEEAVKGELASILPDSGIILDDGTWLSTDSFTDRWADYIAGQHLSSDLKFDTADCLVYEDGYIFVRGELTSDSFTEQEPESSPVMPEGFSYEGRHSYIMDVSMKKTGDGNFQITGWSIPAEIK